MRFREEIVSRILTCICVITLLSVIVVLAIFLKTSRDNEDRLASELSVKEVELELKSEINNELQTAVASADEAIRDMEEKQILMDSDLLHNLRLDLSMRPDLIPEELILKEEDIAAGLMTDQEGKMTSEDKQKTSDNEEKEDTEEEDDLTTESDYLSFPSDEDKDWLIPIAPMGADGSLYLCAAIQGQERETTYHIIYKTVIYLGQPVKDDNNQIIWDAILYEDGGEWFRIDKKDEN